MSRQMREGNNCFGSLLAGVGAREETQRHVEGLQERGGPHQENGTLHPHS